MPKVNQITWTQQIKQVVIKTLTHGIQYADKATPPKSRQLN